MPEQQQFSSGQGMQPLVADKLDDGTVYVQASYGGVTLTKDACKTLAKWLVAAPVVADAPSDDDTTKDGA